MTILEVFDRPLCCSTGICGPAVDPALVRFAADLDWLKKQGVEVHRFNLAFEPAEFTRHEDVKAALRAEQVECLPLLRVNGEIVTRGAYPDRGELARLCGVATDEPSPVGTSAQSCCSGNCC